MSLQYIIDGYNVIRNPSFRCPKKMKDERAALIKLIKNRGLCGSPKNSITIVFDGNPEVIDKRQKQGNINIVFTKEETADERIRKIVEADNSPKNSIVVSDDREVRFFVRSAGARPIGAEEFINRKEKVPAKHKNEREALAVKAELNYSQVHKINQELKKIWLE